jgi:hypothetical protein
VFGLQIAVLLFAGLKLNSKEFECITFLKKQILKFSEKLIARVYENF